MSDANPTPSELPSQVTAHVAESVRNWRAGNAVWATAGLGFATVSGLAVWLLPFSRPNQLMVFAHTLLGVAALAPLLWYQATHLWRYLRKPLSHNLVLGYLSTAAVLVGLVSGVVVTWEAAFGRKLNYGWDLAHIISTIAILGFVVPHILLVVFHERKARAAGGTDAICQAVRRFGTRVLAGTAAPLALVVVVAYVYRPVSMHNEFPADYSWKYGADRPFAPSLAKTTTGGPLDARILSGSRGCGSAGCHEEIVREWETSAHRYSAMDPAFQAIQTTMAKQNGPESTRYCGGCHDPISLFSGTKNLFIPAEHLTSLHGYQEGVSCLVCHSVRQVDVKGNANFVLAAPQRYLLEIEYDQQPTRAKEFLRNFLLRAYPRQHVADLGKQLFKTPEYCAACHKQFVDQEINAVGWVQLQNQYDNWRQSRWNHPKDPKATIECRECHMPLQPSHDPAAGDPRDYNRAANDGKHRSHRFVAANQMIPSILKLPGWEQQVKLTEQWLQGRYEIPEIDAKWAKGAAVGLGIDVPERVRRGEAFPLKVTITSNKVGHDFPTGPLDIIQAWVALEVVDEQGTVLFSSGSVDARHFIEPGSFIFKAEPVDQNGSLIDRHNLWEMVGVRYRRSLFPGFSDSAEYKVVPSRPAAGKAPAEELRAPAGTLLVRARLRYRKVDQYLLNFIFGEKSGLTAPIVDMATETRTIPLLQPVRLAGPAAGGK